MKKNVNVFWEMNYEQFLIIHSALVFYGIYCPQPIVQFLVEKMEEHIKKSSEKEIH